MATGTLTNPCRMEISTLKHNIPCRFVGSATLSTEYSGNTHGLTRIANAQVMRSQLMLLTIQSNELGALGLGAYNDFMALRSEERRVGKECRSRWSPYH